MKKIIVLGAGMVGSAMAIDLAAHHNVEVADINKIALDKIAEKNGNIKTQVADLSQPDNIKTIIKPFDIVLNALPGFLGFNTLKAIIEAGKDVIDISFMPEDFMELNDLAIAKNVTAIADCGVAPGMSNIFLGYYNSKMKISNFECMVGGLPKARKWPFAYKAPFSPIDVIEEYTRTSRYVENNKEIFRDAMSDTELIHFKDVGTLEAFNTDGLRSIITTMSHIPNMKEKTLRYPNHIEYIKVLRDSGFFSNKPITINGTEVKPIDFTSKILFNEWKLGEDEREFTIMQIKITGYEGENQKTVNCYLYDEFSTKTQTSSMARTTGYTATAAINMLLDKKFTEKGVFPPELIGKHEDCFEYIINYLKERDIHYKVSN